jgi:hypothetical protein
MKLDPRDRQRGRRPRPGARADPPRRRTASEPAAVERGRLCSHSARSRVGRGPVVQRRRWRTPPFLQVQRSRLARDARDSPHENAADERMNECVCECAPSCGRSLALSDLQHRGAGRRRRGLEQARERAGCHPSSDVRRVAGVLDEVRVDVERDRDAGMPEDAAHLGDASIRTLVRDARCGVDHASGSSPQPSSRRLVRCRIDSAGSAVHCTER